MLKTVFFGSSDFAASILQNINVYIGSVHGVEFEIRAIITQPDQPTGRKHILTPTLVAKLAEQLGLKVLKPEVLNQNFIDQNQKLLEAQIFVVAAYGKILPEILLKLPKYGAVNIHGSLLPKYRGASPIQTAILNGDKITGVSIILMDKDLDHGPILDEKEVEIASDDTTESLRTKLARIASPLLIETIEKLVSGELKPRVQNHAYTSFCTQIKKEDGYFDINNPPSKEVLDRMIRAYYPWPNVWTRWNGKIVKFYPAPRHPERPSEGSILVQMEGKNKVKLHEFLNGYKDFPINNF